MSFIHKIQHKGYIGKKFKKSSFSFGSFGFKACNNGWITQSQYFLLLKIVQQRLNKEGVFWFKFFLGKNLSTQAVSSRMGKGKGSFCFSVAPVYAGQIFFEICGISKRLVLLIFRDFQLRINFPLKFISRTSFLKLLVFIFFILKFCLNNIIVSCCFQKSLKILFLVFFKIFLFLKIFI